MRFRANFPTEYPNGAIGYAPGGPFDCLGPYAKVLNCPIIVNGKAVARRAAYATAYADTWFSVPAYTYYKGRYIGGYLTRNDMTGLPGIEFRPYDRYKSRLED